ncbi:hypothetical protein SAMN02745857_02216 [Andreprevotia lacus DSM 23236]|uniref:Uncharacterized protein n=1 Tax=Andreprevotia lacus DSM 23236 TaxID=1121001 RepID=A0A1W1XNL4_9NEIS|nr:hypothetical protein [Andreprevotia lacus]SMC25570.1 hypothetical protein SAMN02745857_02216 [Andreprevotia lacus DSM 23236]
MQAIHYAGSDTAVLPGDVVRLKRMRGEEEGFIAYVPGISPPNKFFGVGVGASVGFGNAQGRYWALSVDESGILSSAVHWFARGEAPPELPADLDEIDISSDFCLPAEQLANQQMGDGRIEISRRAPVDDDFKALQQQGTSFGRAISLALLVFGVLAALIYWLSKSWLAASLIGGGLFASSVVSNWRFRQEQQRRRAMAADPQAVEVIEVAPLRVVDIQPLGSNGPALVFFGNDEQAVLVVGQWTAEFEPFPAAHFRIHRWADTGEPIRIECLGKLIVPESSSVALQPGYRFGYVEWFKASPETLQQDLALAFSGGSHA